MTDGLSESPQCLTMADETSSNVTNRPSVEASVVSPPDPATVA